MGRGSAAPELFRRPQAVTSSLPDPLSPAPRTHQAHLAGTVRELAARQRELEAAAPLLRLRLEDFRAQLADLRVSDAAYQELRLLPREARTPLDEVRGRREGGG